MEFKPEDLILEEKLLPDILFCFSICYVLSYIIKYVLPLAIANS